MFDNKGSSNQEVAELITNKQWPSYQLTAIIYYVYYLLEQNHGRGMKALSEENCEACHKDGRQFRITKARMSDPRSNVQDILNRLLNRINNFWLRDL